jgi:glycosyltransferase involved in cell wall biosynthesis
LLVDNDAAQISAAMRRLREDSALARTLIEQGKKRVTEKFSARLMVEGTIQAYRRTLAL